ncbi:hypothetical protein BH18ACI3_BH18ACI3_21130 [soil metagenome]
MPGSGKPTNLAATLTRSKSGWYFLRFPAEMGLRFPTDGRSRRVVCTLDGKHSFQCALLPNKDEFCIGVNKAVREKLGLEDGSVVKVKLQPDMSKYGAPMPVELKEVLKQDREGDRLFHELTAGKQRSLIYMIGTVKNIDKRIHLSLIVLEHIKNNGGKVIDSLLLEEVKRPVF